MKKALKDTEIEQETIQNAFKTANGNFFGSEICNIKLSLFTEKTLFNKEILKIHRNIEDKAAWTTDQ